MCTLRCVEILGTDMMSDVGYLSVSCISGAVSLIFEFSFLDALQSGLSRTAIRYHFPLLDTIA